MSAIDPIALEARKILHFNRDAKYIILSRSAYFHLRDREDANINFRYEKNEITFMGRKVAIIETDEMIIDVGGVK